MVRLPKPSSRWKSDRPLYRPVKSSRSGKKGMVYVKRGGKKRLIHFGDAKMKDYTQHRNKKRRSNYLKRSAGIRDKQGRLTSRDRNSANYWARRVLWPSKDRRSRRSRHTCGGVNRKKP